MESAGNEGEKSLYELLKDAGCATDSWQSDLYVEKTPEALAVITAYEGEGGITNRSEFTSEVDGKRWIELPFHNKNHWDRVAGRDEKAPTSMKP